MCVLSCPSFNPAVQINIATTLLYKPLTRSIFPGRMVLSTSMTKVTWVLTLLGHASKTALMLLESRAKNILRNSSLALEKIKRRNYPIVVGKNILCFEPRLTIDKSTEVAGLAVLLAFVGYVYSADVQEDLFSAKL